jgi:ADP-L-glycero-D-manno-heptose 6-epimerase
MPRSLVTGGAGFIGSNLALALEQRGHEVFASDNFHSADRKNLKGFRGEILSWDCADSSLPQISLDYIFHEAAITDPRHPDDEETYSKNVEGFRNILKLQERTNARLIYASTAGLYGNGPIPMKEDQPKDCLTVYGKSKLQMDEIAATLWNDRPIIGLRYFNVYGPREAHKGRPASMVLHLYRQMKEGKRPRIFKFGEQERDFVYIRDIIGANLCAMTGPSGVYNVGTGVGRTFNDLVESLNQVMGTSLPPEYFDMPFEGSTYQHHTVADMTRAREVLNFKPEWPLLKGVRDYIEWLEGEDNG